MLDLSDSVPDKRAASKDSGINMPTPALWLVRTSGRKSYAKAATLLFTSAIVGALTVITVAVTGIASADPSRYPFEYYGVPNVDGGETSDRSSAQPPSQQADITAEPSRPEITASEPSVAAAVPLPEEADALSPVLKSMVTISAMVPESAKTAKTYGTQRKGSGIILDSSGLIATVGYVIAEAKAVTVTFADNTSSDAEVIAYDPKTELGLVKVLGATKTLSPMKLGNSESVKSNQKVVILSSRGRETAQAVTVGKVKKYTGGWGYILDKAIHTYPPNTDFSGAALLNENAELIGIGALVSIDIDIDPKIRVPGNVFVPINSLTQVLGELMTAGRSRDSVRPWLGIDTKQTRAGLVVGQVIADGPAANSGIAAGDLIVAVDQMKISGLADFYEKVWKSHKPGETVNVLIVRDDLYANVPVVSVDQYDWLDLGIGETQISEIDE